MQIEEAIYERLMATVGVTTLIGTRLYPAQAPQSSTLPVVIYGQAYQKKVQSLTGVINLNQYTMRLDLWASTYKTAKAVYHALRDALIGFQGDLGSGAVTVNGIFEEGGDDGAEPPAHDEETGLYTAGLDLAIWYGN